MRLIGKVIGHTIWIGTGLLMFIFWISTLSRWLGFIGIILSFIFSPGLVVFPFIYWIVEGTFPTLYFLIWGIGLLGMLIVGISSIGDR